MSTITLTPNMNLPVPVVGEEAGPQYATDINSSLTILDQHSHVAGSGVPITPSALNINSDLTLQSNNLTNAKSLRLQSQSAPLSGAADIGCLYESGVDLYYNDGAGNQIRITQSGSVTGSSGTISGLPSGTASASYAGGVFTFQSATNTSANIDAGSYIFRNSTANSKGVTLQPASNLAANYTLTLPTIPATYGSMTLDTSGNISTITRATGTTVAAGGVGISNSSGAFTITNSSNVPVTNFSITITTLGKPVIIKIEPDGTTNPGYVNSTSFGANLLLFRGATQVANWQLNASSVIPSISFTDTPPAGTYTYTVQASTISSGNCNVNYERLIVYELIG